MLVNLPRSRRLLTALSPSNIEPSIASFLSKFFVSKHWLVVKLNAPFSPILDKIDGPAVSVLPDAGFKSET